MPSSYNADIIMTLPTFNRYLREKKMGWSGTRREYRGSIWVYYFRAISLAELAMAARVVAAAVAKLMCCHHRLPVFSLAVAAIASSTPLISDSTATRLRILFTRDVLFGSAAVRCDEQTRAMPELLENGSGQTHHQPLGSSKCKGGEPDDRAQISHCRP